MPQYVCLQFMGVTQALRQTSIASLDLPALLAEIRTALSTALAEAAQQARSAQGAAPGGDAAAAGVEWAALTQAAVPRLVAAVREVLERHLARVRSAPALREFLVRASPAAAAALVRAAPCCMLLAPCCWGQTQAGSRVEQGWRQNSKPGWQGCAQAPLAAGH